MVDNIEKANIIFFAGGFLSSGWTRMDQPNLSLTSCSMKSALLITSSNEVVWSSVFVTDSKPSINQVFFHTVTLKMQVARVQPFYNDANQHVAEDAGNTDCQHELTVACRREKVGDIHAIPVSHGEGKFVAQLRNLQSFSDNGHLTQYVDFSKGNQAWIQNTIQMVLSMRSKVSQVRTVKLLGRWVTQNVSKINLQNIPGTRGSTSLCIKAVKYFTGK